VKVGDKVLISKYGSTEIKIEGENYLICARTMPSAVAGDGTTTATVLAESIKAGREISSGMLKPFADLFPPNHCCFIHAPKNFFVTLSPSG